MVAFEEERLHRDREVQEVRRKVTCNHDMLLSVHCGGGVGVGLSGGGQYSYAPLLQYCVCSCLIARESSRWEQNGFCLVYEPN